MPQKSSLPADSKFTSEHTALYCNPLPATRTGALYNAFSYPTKISPEAIALYIATHTTPGETILDTFAGSGTTGLAAMLCDTPSEEMKLTAKRFRLTPKWGPRKAVLYELSVIGAFIADTLCHPPDPQEFEQAASKLLKEAEKELGWLWKAIDPSGNEGEIRHIIWSDIVRCPKCRTEMSFWDAAARTNPARILESTQCAGCKAIIHLDKVERVFESFHDPILKKSITRKKRVAVRVHGRTNSAKWQRAPLPSDIALANKIETLSPMAFEPKARIYWGDLYRAGYHKGITHLHHFYTRRNFFTIASLLKRAEKFPPHLSKALKLLILSYNASHSTLMTRIVAKTGLKDFVITGAQSGVLYISGLPVEKNVFFGIRRKITALKEAFSIARPSKSSIAVYNRSSTSIHLPKNSVDYVFTDPPFADYIPYSEINQINELWLGNTTNRKEEAIISVAQNKTLINYRAMMTKVFKGIHRTLKPHSKATLVFHSAKAEIWQALAHAYSAAGLHVEASSVLDKVQESFKQVVSQGAVKGDPLLLLSKGPSKKLTQDNLPEKIYNEILKNAGRTRIKAEKTPARLYSRYITRCLEARADVILNAKAFYKRIRTDLKLV